MKMSNQVKVTKVESFTDSQISTIVAKGKLVLIKCEINEESHNGIMKTHIILNNIPYKPIIISETEIIEVGDNLYNPYRKDISNTNSVGKSMQCDYHKILALPEQFSPKHLQAIIDGKLKDGDEVYVECESSYELNGKFLPYPHEKESNHCYIVKTINYKYHIKLFPVKKEEGWGTNFAKYCDSCNRDITRMKDAVLYNIWLENNYNPPTKKK